ncbi:MAG: RNA-binding protein [Pseudorhodoferax sp.]
MSTRIYVGNLAYSITTDALRENFSAYGDVKSAQVMQDRESGRSKGFGFVEMGTAQQAQDAIEALNGAMADGRALTVNEARPREEGGQRGFGGGGRGGYGGGRSSY